MAEILNKIEAALADIHTTTDTSLSALPDHDTILPPSNGITLLDAKNEVFLSYLQALALRNLEVVRDAKALMSEHRRSGDKTKKSKAHEAIVSDLVRHRVYIDKGIRPLEDRLKYQTDKVLKAAGDDERRSVVVDEGSKPSRTATNENDDSESEREADELSFRPNLANMSKQIPDEDEKQSRSDRASTGAYRPPRINATMMPTKTPKDREPKQERNATMDEYINDELSTAPLAQPSVGSTIMAGGRRSKTAKEQKDEDERREYEETNLMRLPKEGRKERGIKRREAEAQLGGEDLRGLGGAADRIGRLTKSSSKGLGALEKSRKRKETEDGPRGDGRAGGAFEQRRRKVMRRLK